MTSTLTDRGSTRSWRNRRQWWTQRIATTPVPCSRCNVTLQPGEDFHLDHVVPRALGGTDQQTWPAHPVCNMTGGVAGVFSDRHPATMGFVSGIPLSEPGSSPGPADSAWDGLGWLDPLREVPDSAVWPRYMTGSHPRATGSYGPEFCGWSAGRRGEPLRWWQQLVACRLLEHDAAGWLVWLFALVTTARQVGKSVLLSELSLWRIHQAERWGQPQMVLLTSKDIPAAKELHRAGRVWARRQPGFRVREANGQEEVRFGESAWAVRATGSVYSYSASVAAVDECWAIDPEIVDDGIEPTTLEKRSPQVQLTSSAHSAATSLFPSRRVVALGELGSPADTLLVEWSAPRDAPVGEVSTWRLASPHWSPQRERLLSAKWSAAQAGVSEDPMEDPLESFRSQYLNQWPVKVLGRRGKDEALFPDGLWEGIADLAVAPPSRLVCAVDDRTGVGAAAAACGLLADGRLLVWGRSFTARARALAWVELLRPAELLVGPALAAQVEGARTVGAADSAAALPRLRELAGAGRLVHDGGPELALQVKAARVAERSGGLVLTASLDVLRCAAWAVWASAAAPPRRPSWAAA
jgi:hypothetical protein